jgi:hypothetical protein
MPNNSHTNTHVNTATAKNPHNKQCDTLPAPNAASEHPPG